MAAPKTIKLKKNNKKKKKKKAGNSWIKQNAKPVIFSRQKSILKLRQIATVSKAKKKTKNDENDSKSLQNNANKRDMTKFKQALKDENSAMENCVTIMDDFGFLKCTKDDESYTQLLKSQENEDLNQKKQKKGVESSKNDLDEMKQEDKNNDMDAEEERDLFYMNNSNLLLLLNETNCQTLMRIISKSLIQIQSLRFIEMCNCGVDDYFMSQICLQLLENKNECKLNTLSLQSNYIGDNGFLCLCEIIMVNNKYLKVIKLQNNRKDISTGVCQQICDALEINDYIIKFEFEFRHFGEKDRVNKALKKNAENARIQKVACMDV